MFKQFQASETKLREKAIFNSYCYKKVQQLKEKLRILLELYEQNKTKKHQLETQNRQLAEELGNAHSTIDTIELLNKTEDALKYDIKELMKQKRQLELFINNLRYKLQRQ